MARQNPSNRWGTSSKTNVVVKETFDLKIKREVIEIK